MSETLEQAAQVAEWRRKALNNEMTADELRQWIELVREGRVSASATSSKSRASKAPVDIDSMMDELDGLK